MCKWEEIDADEDNLLMESAPWDIAFECYVTFVLSDAHLPQVHNQMHISRVTKSSSSFSGDIEM